MTSRKAALRKRLRAERQAFSPALLCAGSAAIAKRVRGLEAYASSRVVALYWAFREEVDTRALCADVLAEGKVLLLPRMESAERLSLRRVDDTEALCTGRFGILEPPASAVQKGPDDVDLFIVPGLAFDARGGRLGYGRGYYDRLLSAASKASTFAGLCLEAQLVAEVPMEDHDVPMHVVITDRRILQVTLPNDEGVRR